MRYAAITDRLAELGGRKWAIHNATRERIAAGESIIELTIGEPDVPIEPNLIKACSVSMQNGRTRYSPGRGEPGLLRAIASKYEARHPKIAESNILCFPGTQTALFAVMTALIDSGDGVLAADPYYATYEGVVCAAGGLLQPVPLSISDGFALRPSIMASAVTDRSRVMLLNTPHNPTGLVLNREELVELGKIAMRHDLWIVCDEVYEDLVFDGVFASPLEIAELRDRTIVVSSISKSFAATGFRSGWAIGPAEFCTKLLPISEAMLFGNQPFIADMTAVALMGSFDTAVRMRRNYATRLALVQSELKECSYLQPKTAAGGMFVMIDVSGTGLTGLAFAEALLDQEKVAVMPGASFGRNAESLIRVALTVPDVTLREAVGRMRTLAERYVRRTVLNGSGRNSLAPTRR